MSGGAVSMGRSSAVGVAPMGRSGLDRVSPCAHIRHFGPKWTINMTYLFIRSEGSGFAALEFGSP